MCGITGWFSETDNNSVLPQQCLAPMLAAIKHRGPDGQGEYIFNKGAMGHVRLSIIDLEHGQQPMQSMNKQLTISFNGEIYNYRELRQHLQKKGVYLHTHSDTEVILGLYQSMGIKGFTLLRGMYAFAIWDEAKQSGYLVRDPLGIKPLFYTQTHEDTAPQLIYGSEAKAILAHPDTHSELDTSSLHALMNFRYLPDTQSLLTNITQLKPGEVIHWQAGKAIQSSQIQVSHYTAHDNDILASLDDSINAHFTSDVEVGCYLSGGIDSAAICALGKKYTNTSLQTFTLDAGDDPLEADYARRSAEILELDNHQQSIEFNPAKSLPEMLWHMEVPKINSLQIKLLAQVAAQKVKVCLSGLGGDEVFYGYNVHRFMHQANKLSKILPGITHRWPGMIGKSLIDSLSSTPFTESARKGQIVQSLGQWSTVYGLMRNVWDTPKLRQLIYGPRMLDATLPDSYEQIESLWPQNTDPVEALAQFENKHKLVNDLLWQEDRMSMACGLEVRVPFVDQSFLNTVHSYQRKQLMPHGKPKALMRELLNPLLGSEIIQRPKSGFQVSSPDFYHQHLSSMATYWLSPERITAYGLFNPLFVKKILSFKPSKRLRWHYFVLYLMLLTHIWIEIFENDASYDQLQHS